MKEKIYDLIARRDHVTFVELAREIEGFDGGTFAVEIGPNVLLWNGVSQAAVDATRELLTERRITITPTTVLTYLIDGVTLDLPLAKRPRRRGYKKPHWLPVCFRPAPTHRGSA